jgi:NADH-quinone oxidoreductase subunit J
VTDILLALAGALAASSAVGVVVNRRPIYSALSLVVNMLSLALIFVILSAQFLAVAQVIVYAGAVMVLFVFVIALLNPGRDETLARDTIEITGSVLLGATFVALSALAFLTMRSITPQPGAPGDKSVLAGQSLDTLGSIQSVGHALFVDYAYPFEVTSMVLVVAAVGAVYLSRGR